MFENFNLPKSLIDRHVHETMNPLRIGSEKQLQINLLKSPNTH